MTGVQNKIEKVKSRRERNRERQGLDFVRQKKQTEADRQERINVIENKYEDPCAPVAESINSTGTGDSSIKERLAKFKSGRKTGNKPAQEPGRFARFGKKDDNK